MFDTKYEKMSDLEKRVYTSRLLGSDDSLVLHGGGNTSVKIDNTLYVKGSGWDLATIEKEGFSPVDLKTLQNMATYESLSDTQMVQEQKEAMSNKTAPSPSVEAILHAIIPFKYVDHTHANSIVTISNSINGEKIIKELYKDYLIIPYVMPGFILAKKVYEMSIDIDWSSIKGIILHNHGVFTFDNDAKISYDKMIESVSIATNYLKSNADITIPQICISEDGFDIDRLQKLLDNQTIMINQSPLAVAFASRMDLEKLVNGGVLTPEHVLRTKRLPLILQISDNIEKKIKEYQNSYIEYFSKYAVNKTILSTLPKWIIVIDYGTITIGKDAKECRIITDINNHTMLAMLRASKLGGYRGISESDTFDMEYWELEQAKIKK
jgi:rhamnose utilization protein RhaD (predicted bifunctional aldolase and dehydrogenase)